MIEVTTLEELATAQTAQLRAIDELTGAYVDAINAVAAHLAELPPADRAKMIDNACWRPR